MTAFLCVFGFASLLGLAGIGAVTTWDVLHPRLKENTVRTTGSILPANFKRSIRVLPPGTITHDGGVEWINMGPPAELVKEMQEEVSK
jgi:hypothetical protein